MLNSLVSSPRRRAVALLVLTALLWSSSGLLIKLCNWPALAILSGRSIVAGLTVLLSLGMTRRVELRFSPWQVVGAFSYVGTQLLFITATKLTTAANAIFLQYSAPLWVLLLGWPLLRERPRRADWIAMVVIAAGLVLFFGDQLQLSGVQGNILALVSGVLLAALTLSMRGHQGSAPANTFLLGAAIGAVAGLPWLLRADFTLADAGIIVYLGVFQMGLALILYSAAARHVPALETSLILTLEPILNPIWVFLVIQETPGPLALVGAVLVIGAVTARAIVSARSKEASDEFALSGKV